MIGNNKIMQGRIFGVKKSIILKFSVAVSTILFCFSTIYFMFFSNYKDLWFYSFCIEAGFCIFLKGFLLKIDSLNFFGMFLIALGGFYIYNLFFSIEEFYVCFVFLALALSSAVNFCVFKSKLHIRSFVFFLIISYLIFFLQINVIPLLFFVAILLFSVVIFILSTAI